MEKELKSLLAEMDNKQAEIKNLQQHIQRNKEEQLKMEQHLKEQKVGYTKYYSSGLRLGSDVKIRRKWIFMKRERGRLF